LAVKFTVSIRTKAHSKLSRKGGVGVSRDCPKLVPDLRTTSLLYAHLGSFLRALFTCCSQSPRVWWALFVGPGMYLQGVVRASPGLL